MEKYKNSYQLWFPSFSWFACKCYGPKGIL